MEKLVSGNIKNIIDVCDGSSGHDYYSADWLTGTWLVYNKYGTYILYIYNTKADYEFVMKLLLFGAICFIG